jgi:serine protease Do
MNSLIQIIKLMLYFFSFVTSCNAEQLEGEFNENNSLNDSKVSNELIAKSEADQDDKLNKLNNNIVNSRNNAITSAVKKVNPAIVGINITQTQQYIERDPFYNHPFFRRFFGGRSRGRVREYEVHSLGSGFIISKDGYILTNHHVAGSATKIIVTMTNGKEYEAEIIGSDMVSDVALLKIESDEDLPYLEFADSDDVIIGEWVLAFGNPFGLFDKNAKPTVTIGIVSNANINFIESDKPYNRVYRNMIQTDAAISSGNSGGPLVNALGQVIGMNTMIWSTANSRAGAGSIGIGFAIPINRVKEIIDILKRDKKIDRNFYTGLDIKVLDDKLAEYLNIDKKDGVIVYSIKRGSPAERSGLEPGDVILSVDGFDIIRDEDYYVIINDAFTGDILEFEILRDGKIKKLEMELSPINERRF